MRISMPAKAVVRLGMIGVGVGLAGSGCAKTVVTLTPAATSLHATETTTVSAAVTTNAQPAAAATIAFTSGAGGAVTPATAVTDAQGLAQTTFTGGVVTEDTPVTVTATAVGTGTTVITVKPPIAFDDFGPATATTSATADITVTPSISRTPAGLLRCSYVVTQNTAVSTESPRSVSLTFQTPMTLFAATSTAGTVASQSANQGLVWLFNVPSGNPAPNNLTRFSDMTLVLDTDGDPGGTVQCDILEDSPGGITHAVMAVAGPKP